MSRKWTEKTDREADVLFRTFSETEVRRRQDLADQQIRLACEQRNETALADLNAMRDALTREMMRRNTARDRRTPVLGGLRIEKRNAGWAVTHDSSGLEAVSGLRQRRFAEEARDELLATGTDFTQDAKAISGQRGQWINVYIRWHLRARQDSFDVITFEYYSAFVRVGTFVPSARWAADMRAAHATGDIAELERLLKPVPYVQACRVTLP